MSATIDTTLFSNYFNNCPVLEVEGKVFPVQEYYLEDAIELTHFIASPKGKKKKSLFEEDDREEENLNAVCDTLTYSLTTQQSMALLSEKDIPFELIEFHFMALAIDVINRRGPSSEMRRQLQPQKTKCQRLDQCQMMTITITVILLAALYYHRGHQGMRALL